MINAEGFLEPNPSEGADGKGIGELTVSKADYLSDLRGDFPMHILAGAWNRLAELDWQSARSTQGLPEATSQPLHLFQVHLPVTDNSFAYTATADKLIVSRLAEVNRDVRDAMDSMRSESKKMAAAREIVGRKIGPMILEIWGEVENKFLGKAQ